MSLGITPNSITALHLFWFTASLAIRFHTFISNVIVSIHQCFGQPLLRFLPSSYFKFFSTPPTRTLAFEDFKKGKGTEINRIFVENQELLSQKKKSYSQLARQINSIKAEIDKTMVKLDELKNGRESEGMSCVTKPCVQSTSF